ncbi:pilus assembly protein PilM [Paenibacillus albicereus]|uniref:Pilus assembly protein PilM n=1 Tax=Paenibacillus albicereus TaxID=2726185 RepID=A0A6H2GS25_9BACL|nr:pilus assembly protein PilM [Paenibacillus albicereus]QJC50214.1 pilus assembly protein PilM [Paenibacillus albicereus]
MPVLGRKRIGIAIDATGIRYAPLGKKGLDPEQAGFFPFPPGLIAQDVIVNEESLRLSIREWARERRLQGAAVVLAVPTSQVIVRKMALPAASDRELRQLIHLEVETVMHLPFEHPVYDYVLLGQGGESSQALVYAAPRSWIEPLAAMLREARIRVVGTSLVATALQGAAGSGDETLHERMHVHLSEASAEIAMFHEGHPVFVRSIEEDGADEELSSLRVGELTAEITRMLSFYEFGLQEGRSRIRQAVITGGGRQAEALRQSLAAALPEVEFRGAEPGSLAAESMDGPAEPYVVPAGLLVRGSGIRRLNLLPRVDREQRLAPLAAALLAVAWIACAALLGYSYAGERQAAADAQERLLNASQQQLALQRQLDGLNRQAGGTEADPYEQAEQIRAAQRDAAGYVRDLEHYLPTGAELQSIAYSSGGQLSLTVRMGAMKDSSRYLFDIRRIEWLDQATLASLKQEQTGAEAGSATAYLASYTLILKPIEPAKEGDSDGG